MPVTSVDPFALHVLGARSLPASSASFQTMVGVDTEAEALEFVYDQTAPADAVRPLAVLFMLDSRCARGGFWTSTCELWIEREVPVSLDETHPFDPEIEFRNTVGPIIKEMYDKSYEGGYMPLRNPIKTPIIIRSNPDKETGKSYYRAVITLECGVE